MSLIEVASLRLIFVKGPDCSCVCAPAVVSWPGQPALSRLLSDAYLSVAQVYLRGVYLKPAAHLPKLRERQCLINGNPPTETVDRQLLMTYRLGGGKRGKSRNMRKNKKEVNRKVGMG